MKDREVILDVLRRVGRRLWIRQALEEVLFGVCAFLFFLIAFKLVASALALPVPAVGIMLALAVAVAGYLALRLSRPVTPGQAAAEADARAALRDELKSAYWFMSNPAESPFADLQIARASATAARLDPALIVPQRLPRPLAGVAGLGLLLAVLGWMSPQLTPWWTAAAAPEAAVEEASPLSARELLLGAPEDEQLQKLDQALAALEDQELPAEQKMRAAAQAREAIAQANMEAAAAREGLVRLAESIKSNPGMEDVALALSEGRTADAIALLKQKAQQQGSAADAPDMGDQRSQLKKGRMGEYRNSLEDKLEKAGRDLGNLDSSVKVNQESVNDAVTTIEAIAGKIEAQAAANQVRRRMEEDVAANAHSNSLTATQSTAGADTPNPTPAGGAGRVPGSMYQKLESTGEPSTEIAHDGNPLGSSGAGESEALPLEGEATARLDAQLKLEAIQRGDDDKGGDANGDDSWFYSATQQKASELAYENVSGRGGFDREGATERGRVPIRQQKIVKNYFLNLHESENK